MWNDEDNNPYGSFDRAEAGTSPLDGTANVTVRRLLVLLGGLGIVEFLADGRLLRLRCCLVRPAGYCCFTAMPMDHALRANLL